MADGPLDDSKQSGTREQNHLGPSVDVDSVHLACIHYPTLRPKIHEQNSTVWAPSLQAQRRSHLPYYADHLARIDLDLPRKSPVNQRAL